MGLLEPLFFACRGSVWLLRVVVLEACGPGCATGNNIMELSVLRWQLHIYGDWNTTGFNYNLASPFCSV